VHPQGHHFTLFDQEGLHGLVIKIIYNICVQFFIRYHLKNA
jgi:hypothetical protein